MIDECIHGLDRNRCDICTPRVVPKPEAAALAAPRIAKPPAARAAPRRLPGSTSKAQQINVGEQRIHHVTHINNLADILANGAVHADASDTWSERPEVDIASSDNRDGRRNTVVPAAGSASIAEYVPFFLSPNASLWQVIRAGSSDPRLSSATRGFAASEFVILVSTVAKVRQGGVDQGSGNIVVTDGDAADPRTRFATTNETWERMLRRIVADDDAVRHAEFLVEGAVPFEAVSVIGVANDRARDAVKAILRTSEYAPRVAVHPPWFAVSMDA